MKVKATERHSQNESISQMEEEWKDIYSIFEIYDNVITLSSAEGKKIIKYFVDYYLKNRSVLKITEGFFEADVEYIANYGDDTLTNNQHLISYLKEKEEKLRKHTACFGQGLCNMQNDRLDGRIIETFNVEPVKTDFIESLAYFNKTHQGSFHFITPIPFKGERKNSNYRLEPNKVTPLILDFDFKTKDSGLKLFNIKKFKEFLNHFEDLKGMLTDITHAIQITRSELGFRIILPHKPSSKEDEIQIREFFKKYIANYFIADKNIYDTARLFLPSYSPVYLLPAKCEIYSTTVFKNYITFNLSVIRGINIESMKSYNSTSNKFNISINTNNYNKNISNNNVSLSHILSLDNESNTSSNNKNNKRYKRNSNRDNKIKVSDYTIKDIIEMIEKRDIINVMQLFGVGIEGCRNYKNLMALLMEEEGIVDSYQEIMYDSTENNPEHSDKYFRFSISAEEDTKGDAYYYPERTYAIWLQSENSIERLPEYLREKVKVSTNGKYFISIHYLPFIEYEMLKSYGIKVSEDFVEGFVEVFGLRYLLPNIAEYIAKKSIEMIRDVFDSEEGYVFISDYFSREFRKGTRQELYKEIIEKKILGMAKYFKKSKIGRKVILKLTEEGRKQLQLIYDNEVDKADKEIIDLFTYLSSFLVRPDMKNDYKEILLRKVDNFMSEHIITQNIVSYFGGIEDFVELLFEFRSEIILDDRLRQRESYRLRLHWQNRFVGIKEQQKVA